MKLKVHHNWGHFGLGVLWVADERSLYMFAAWFAVSLRLRCGR